jgi:hypothetical protein
MKIKQYTIRLGHDYYNNHGEFSSVTISAPKFLSMDDVSTAYDEIHKDYGLGLLHDCETIETEIEI